MRTRPDRALRARRWLGMRWWLTLAFALVAAVTAGVVVWMASEQSERAFRESARELSIGHSVAAAEAVLEANGDAPLDPLLETLAAERRLALFVYDDEGRLITATESNGIPLSALPQRAEALEAALAGQRYIRSSRDGTATIVALALRGETTRALLAYSLRPEVATQLGIVREQVARAAWAAAALGALVGLVIAQLITLRLRRIAAAAEAIDAGNFDHSVRDGFPDELGALAESIDRTRVRLRESFESLAHERDRLRRLLGELHEGVIMIGPELEVEFANEAAPRLLGVPALEEGEQLPDPWPSPSLREFARAVLAADAQRASDTQVALADGRTYELVGVRGGEGGGNAVLVVTDISERERRERAQREFVTNAAHELRTPVAAIVSTVEMLQAGAKDVPEERELFLAHVERESKRLGRLARALLVLARAQTGEEELRPVPVRVCPLLETVAGSLSPASGVDLEVRCDAELAVATDPDLLEQALTTVAVNAARYTSRGRIELAARLDDSGDCVISVSDTGSGVAPGEQERIFDRFYRGGDRNAEGFGLGLPIARQVVEALGGTIDVRSEPGAGTTVAMRLPHEALVTA